MVDTSTTFPTFSGRDLPDQMSSEDVRANRFTEAALARHKQEGLDLAVKARWVALAVIAVMLPFLNPRIEVLYYEALLVLMAANGWLLRRVGRVGVSRTELLVIFIDVALMTFALVAPNPFAVSDWPTAMGYRFDNFIYFFVILASGTLAFSWRTIIALGNWAAAMWMIGVGLVWWFGTTYPDLTVAAYAAFGSDPNLAELLDPNSLNFEGRVQQVVVFIICAYTLALTVRRFNRLLLGNAALERERTNLSRYFSPTMVDELSNNDEPLKQIKNHNVAVLFVDIIGFTQFAADRHPEEVIKTLRGFHGRMETEVFQNNGTLDKYLGDGLMATFGTPVAGPMDGSNALRCARAMILAMVEWNAARLAAGEPEIRASFGLHYGPVVLGDIGANRLEFAVIGNTVNVASRLESKTRDLSVQLVVSDQARAQAMRETDESDSMFADLTMRDGIKVRGLEETLKVWTI
jgi:adenylate cyclase